MRIAMEESFMADEKRGCDSGGDGIGEGCGEGLRVVRWWTRTGQFLHPHRPHRWKDPLRSLPPQATKEKRRSPMFVATEDFSDCAMASVGVTAVAASMQEHSARAAPHLPHPASTFPPAASQDLPLQTWQTSFDLSMADPQTLEAALFWPIGSP